MSVLVGAARPHPITTRNEYVLHGDWVQDQFAYVTVLYIGEAAYTSGWGVQQVVSPDGVLASLSWAAFDQTAGAAARYGFVGVSRDQYGSPLGGCTLKLFRTSGDTLLDTTTSDATTGAFLLNTAYFPDYHYITCHKSGSPDVDGITQNTLIGA
jgi:hypothetical protein